MDMIPEDLNNFENVLEFLEFDWNSKGSKGDTLAHRMAKQKYRGNNWSFILNKKEFIKNVRNDEGHTVLDLLISNPVFAVQVFEKGENQVSWPEDGSGPLLQLCRDSNYEMAFMIASKCPEDRLLDLKDSEGKTALCYAVLDWELDFAGYLVGRGASLENEDANGLPLMSRVLKWTEFKKKFKKLLTGHTGEEKKKGGKRKKQEESEEEEDDADWEDEAKKRESRFISV